MFICYFVNKNYRESFPRINLTGRYLSDLFSAFGICSISVVTLVVVIVFKSGDREVARVTLNNTHDDSENSKRRGENFNNQDLNK